MPWRGGRRANFWRIGPPALVKCQKGPPLKFLSKETTPGWRHVWPGDMWHVPPGPTTARGCRQCQNWHVTWQVTLSTLVSGGGPCRLGRCRQGDVAHAANAKTGTLPYRIPTITAMIPTLTALIFRCERGQICCDDSLHVICNLCYFHLSIRCFDTLFRTVNRLQLSQDRIRRPLTSSPFKGQQPHACSRPAPSLI
jgi:hypothetical protein